MSGSIELSNKSKTNAIMEVQGIDLSYGTNPVVEDLSTTICSGSFVGLIGPNGAGKTTLLLSLSGQFKPQKGKILFGDSDIYERNIEFKQVTGYVHENPFFYPYLSVEEFLHFIARIKNVPKSEIESQVSSALESVCLAGESKNSLLIFQWGCEKN